MTMTTRLAAVAAAAMAAPDKIIAHIFTTAAGRGPKFTRIGDSPNRNLTLAGNLCWKVNPFSRFHKYTSSLSFWLERVRCRVFRRVG